MLRLTIRTPDPAGQELTLPAWIPGSYLIRDFSRQIETIHARHNKQSIPIEKTGNHSWRCAPCAGPLIIEYVVYAWDLSVRGAHLDESHAFFNGSSVFLCPSGFEDNPCHVEFCRPAHGRDWKVYTSLPQAQGLKQPAKRHGFGVYAAPNYDALIDFPVEMGTPQTVRFNVHGAEHEIVFTGVIPNLDTKRIAADTKKICASQIELFEPISKKAPFLDSSNRYVFLTTITGDGYGGLEHRASCALIASRHDLPTIGNEPAEGYQTFLGLISHEYFHTWNVKRIKPAAFAPYDLSRENHTRLLWVFEGFTSYYDDLMLLRSGTIARPDYLRLLGKAVSNVRRATGRRKQTIAESSFDAWTRYYKQDENSPNALVSYYTKGSLVALGLDLTIRQATANARSLDDVMRLLWVRYGRDFYSLHKTGVPENAVTALIHEATGVDVSEFIKRHVDGYEDVPLEGLLAGQGLTIKWKAAGQAPSLDARTRVTQGEVQLAAVYEGGAAHQAGLSAGDSLVAIDGLRVAASEGLDRLLKAYRAGDKAMVTVFRRDELRRFAITLAAAPTTECQIEPI